MTKRDINLQIFKVMRKVFYILAAVLLGACSEGFEQGESLGDASDEMRFAIAAAEVSARASLTYTTNLTEVGLYGYCTTADSPTIMANALFTKDSDTEDEWSCYDAPTWSYEGSSDRFSFYGYAPYSTTAEGITALDDGSGVSIDYNMAANYDLLLASTTEILRPAGGMVSLTFNHALAAISVTTDGYENVESITLSGTMVTAGTVALSSSEVAWETASAENYTEFSYDVPTEDDEYLMAIPQKLTSDLTVTITISFSDGTTADVTHTIPATKTDTTTDPATTTDTTWEPGMIYNYTCKSSGDLVDNIIIIKTDDDGTITNYDDIIEYITNTLGDSDGEYTYFVIEGEISSELMAAILAIKTDDGGYVVTGLDLSNADITDLTNNSSDSGTELDDYSTTLKSWSQITTLVLPSTITSLGSGVYDNLIKSWKSIEVLDMSATQITTIGNSDFKAMKDDDNFNITTIIFPATLTSIGVDAIQDSTSLENVYFYSSTIYFGNKCFSNCGTLNLYFYHEEADVKITEGDTPFDGNTNPSYNYYYTYYYDDEGNIQFKSRTD